MFANLLYVAALVLVSPLVLYRSIRHGRYRRGISQKLFGLSRVEAQSLVQNASTESRLGNVRKQFPDFTLPLGGSSEARGGPSINSALTLPGPKRSDPPGGRVKSKINMPKLFPNGS